MTETLSRKLHLGLEELQLPVSDDQRQKLISYVLLLAKWNKKHNLTAVKSPLEMITRHVLDSLSVAKFLQGATLLDIGAGAGLPGIPLAITHSKLSVTLVDRVIKKTQFMQVTAGTLRLTNVNVEHCRVEALNQDLRVDMVTARAFAEIDVLCRLATPFLMNGGRVLAMIGKALNDEQMERLCRIEGYSVPRNHKLEVPGEQGERNLVVLQRCEVL